MEEIKERLIARNKRECACYETLIDHYASHMDKLIKAEHLSFTLQRDMALVSSNSIPDSAAKISLLEAKVVKLQDEVAASYKIINEKSDLLIRLKEQTIQDHSAVQQSQSLLFSAQQQLIEANAAKEDVLKQLQFLQDIVDHQNEEITSLRVIHDTLQKQIAALKSDNTYYLEQIMIIKNDQAEEMNKMTDMLKSLKDQLAQAKEEIASAAVTAPTSNPSQKRSNSLATHASFDDIEIKVKESISTPSSIAEKMMSGLSSSSIPAAVLNTFNTSAEISSISFDESARRFISGGVDKLVRIWSVTEGKNSQRFSGPEKAILDVDISYDGTQVLSAGNDPGIYVWSLKYQRLTQCLNGHSSKISCAKFNSNSLNVYSGSFDRSIKIWDLENSTCTTSLPCVSSCYYVDLSQDANTLASAHLDSHVRIWSLNSNEMIQDLSTIHSKAVTCVKFCRLGHLLLSSGKDGQINVIDVRKWQSLRSFSDSELKNSTISPHFSISPDSAFVVTGNSAGSLLVWDVESGKRKKILRGHASAVTSCSWSPHGTNIVSADKEGNILLWG